MFNPIMAANLKSMTDKSHQNSSATPADSFFFLALFVTIMSVKLNSLTNTTKVNNRIVKTEMEYKISDSATWSISFYKL